MKEQTYGWYPSAKNVYTDRRMGAPTPYQLEAMYRFRDSKYYEPAITPQEQRSVKSATRPTPTPTSVRRPTSSTSHASKISQQSVKDIAAQLRARSAPVYTAYKPPPRLNIPTPQQCWSTHVPETEITVLPPQPSPAPPQHSVSLPRSASPVAESIQERTAKKIERIKSATIRRETPSKPKRPVKSAGPVRPESKVAEEYIDTSASPIPRPPSRPNDRPPSSTRTPSRPKAPSPYQMEAHGEMDDPPDYNEQVKKHGWMMEVHGDPLKLKKTYKRLPYTVKVADPALERDPPRVHMENLETFFLNTIPRRPMAFTIDKEWISEMIHAKRMELQKKQGINYRYKNFSFVY